jgi:Tfp pilus assembly protein PilF
MSVKIAPLRLTVQLVDVETGAHLWADTYNRPFDPTGIFALQDDLVPRIVSTVADAHGVLPHSMSEALRSRDPRTLRPHEILLRGMGYLERLTPDEHAEVREMLERAVREAPGHADCWALLSSVYNDEHRQGFNPKPGSLDRALEAARRAVRAAPSNGFAHQALAHALFFRREFQAFRAAADRALALNPMDGSSIAFLGILIAYAGDWDRGCALVEKANRAQPARPGLVSLRTVLQCLSEAGLSHRARHRPELQPADVLLHACGDRSCLRETG